MGLAGFFTIIRPVNSVVAGLAAIVAYLIATGTLVPGVILLMAVVTLITAAGNVINDYFDAGIDAINRPERPIPSGAVSRDAALVYAGVLFFLGILLAGLLRRSALRLPSLMHVLLVAYAARLKSTPFFGNVAVSYLAASIFLFGGALAGGYRLVDMLPLAVITFLAMLARELLKDAEDIEGDRPRRADTLPIRSAYGRPLFSHSSLQSQPLRQACCPISGGGRGISPVSPLSISSLSLRHRGARLHGSACLKRPDRRTFSRSGCLPPLWYSRCPPCTFELPSHPGDNNLYAQGHASSTLIHFMANVIRKGSTYYAPKGSYYEGNVRIDGDFIVPARTHFWGRLVVTGRLELGMKSSVALDVECGSAIIGSHARVKGPLVASGDVTLLDHCVVYSVEPGGRLSSGPMSVSVT